MPSLNPMNELGGLSFSWNQVIPAPCDHQCLGQAQHPVRDCVPPMMVIKQPRINVAFLQRRLDGRQVHGQTIIVNKAGKLRESVPATINLRSVGEPDLQVCHAALAEASEMWRSPAAFSSLSGADQFLKISSCA